MNPCLKFLTVFRKDSQGNVGRHGVESSAFGISQDA